MKTKKNLLVVLFIIAMTLPFLSKAQTNNKSLEWATQPKQVGWKPVKLDDKGNNVQNGVEFYSQKGECINAQNVSLAKLVNTNNYAVKVSYQISADSPVINVRVGASATVEGSCSTTDSNLAKLAIPMPVAKTDEEKQKNREYIRAHIVVSQL